MLPGNLKRLPRTDRSVGLSEYATCPAIRCQSPTLVSNFGSAARAMWRRPPSAVQAWAKPGAIIEELPSFSDEIQGGLQKAPKASIVRPTRQNMGKNRNYDRELRRLQIEVVKMQE